MEKIRLHKYWNKQEFNNGVLNLPIHHKSEYSQLQLENNEFSHSWWLKYTKIKKKRKKESFCCVAGEFPRMADAERDTFAGFEVALL